MPINSTVKNLFSRSRLLETGYPTVTLDESELYAIFLLICSDLKWDIAKIGLKKPTKRLPHNNYYKISLGWFSSHKKTPTIYELQETLGKGIDIDSDFGLYFLNLCSLHKRRLKFQKILQYQPKPTMDQVGPRGLLEYGICDNDMLNSWLIWRKWIFDIDNRSGQETGYLFEPILASCLVGEAVGSTNSPVKRLDENGKPKATGRQIDCYIGAENVAYEFKIRVTIAASGQGRFGEELSFSKECRAAGITPILIVLDPTSSSRLTELTNVFKSYKGEVYIGEKAWKHLEEKAGKIMSHFINNYIKPPLKRINDFDTSKLSSIKLTWDKDKIIIQGDTKKYRIERGK
ncbi:MAG: restriction endonuclease [Bacteroidetes bacterium]|nr:restriction endonuclease [Bacteroidota bacterium]